MRSFTLTQPAVLAVTGAVTQPNCNSANSGAINITVTGGTTPYTYAWTGTGVNASAEDQMNLAAGTYGVTVTEANSCTTTASFTLNAASDSGGDRGQ